MSIFADEALCKGCVRALGDRGRPCLNEAGQIGVHQPTAAPLPQGTRHSCGNPDDLASLGCQGLDRAAVCFFAAAVNGLRSSSTAPVPGIRSGERPGLAGRALAPGGAWVRSDSAVR